MTTVDSNGIIRYQTTDPVSPLQTLLNLGMQSVSDAITPLNARSFKTVTSTTRPAHLAGLRIYETDTKKSYISDGTNWTQILDTTMLPRVWVLSPALGGPISSNDLVANQTIPANLYSTSTYNLQVSASIQSIIAGGGGTRLEVLVDNAVVKSATFGNGAPGAQNMSLTVDLTSLVLSSSTAHSVRARVVSIAGANTVSANSGDDRGQAFSYGIYPLG